MLLLQEKGKSYWILSHQHHLVKYLLVASVHPLGIKVKVTGLGGSYLPLRVKVTGVRGCYPPLEVKVMEVGECYPPQLRA